MNAAQMSVRGLCTYVSGHLTELRESIISKVGHVDVNELLNDRGLLMELTNQYSNIVDSFGNLLVMPVRIKVKRYREMVLMDLGSLIDHIRQLPKGAALTLPDGRIVASDEVFPDEKTLRKVSVIFEKFGIKHATDVEWSKVRGYNTTRRSISLLEARKSKFERSITNASSMYYWFSQFKTVYNVGTLGLGVAAGSNIINYTSPGWMRPLGMSMSDPVTLVMFHVI